MSRLKETKTGVTSTILGRVFVDLVEQFPIQPLNQYSNACQTKLQSHPRKTTKNLNLFVLWSPCFSLSPSPVGFRRFCLSSISAGSATGPSCHGISSSSMTWSRRCETAKLLEPFENSWKGWGLVRGHGMGPILGGIKQYKSMVKFEWFTYNLMHCLDW